MKIIGIIGNKGAGKDTLGEHLTKKNNYTRYSFGDPVKQICEILFNLDKEQLYGNKKDIIDEDEESKENAGRRSQVDPIGGRSDANYITIFQRNKNCYKK